MFSEKTGPETKKKRAEENKGFPAKDIAKESEEKLQKYALIAGLGFILLSVLSLL